MFVNEMNNSASLPITITIMYLLVCGVVVYYIYLLLKGGIFTPDKLNDSAEQLLIKDRINLINRQIGEAYDAKFYQQDKDYNRVLDIKIENLRKEKKVLEEKLK